jgi:N-acetylglutamate synthase-like GNAT family acetyltransferase
MASLERALSGDPVVLAWLRAVKLPTDGLVGGGANLFVLSEQGQPLAAGAIEGTGEDVLLRFVVTAPAFRGRGYGRQMVSRLSAVAKAEGVRRLWLLPGRAEAFFARLGWTASDLDRAPAEVRATAQFETHQAASSVLMCRAL